jgi:hypothetical protein
MPTTDTRTPISAATDPARERRADRFALGAFAWAVAAGLALAVVPIGTSSTAYSNSSVVTTTHESLVQTNGAGVLIVLGVPALLTLVAFLVKRRPVRAVLSGLLFVGCVLGAMSVGVFFLPAAVLLICAAAP